MQYVRVTVLIPAGSKTSVNFVKNTLVRNMHHAVADYKTTLYNSLQPHKAKMSNLSCTGERILSSFNQN